METTDEIIEYCEDNNIWRDATQQIILHLLWDIRKLLMDDKEK